MNFEQILRQQRSFFHSQKTKDTAFRKENLKKLKSILQENEHRLFEAIHADFGKSTFDTYSTEVGLIYTEIGYYLKNLSRLSRPRRVGTNLMNLPGSSRIHREPFGCVLVIGAWNYPYYLTLMPLIAALAAGNTCILKPSELPERTMKLLASLINGNFPADYLYVAEGGVPETTELLKLKFDKIFFTGSPRVGRIVYEAAAKNLIPVTLELGGKSPAIVTRHGNLEAAAKRIVWGKFLNAGQTCIAPDYVLVEHKVKHRLLELIKKRLDEAAYEDGAEQYVQIIDEKNFDRVSQLIEPSKVVYGGGLNKQTRYIQPTVMDNVDWNDPVMQQEIFGPVLPVLTFRTFEDALTEVLDREKPLAAYLFSSEKQEQRLFTNVLSFGGGCINDTVMHIANDRLPFGGVGNSGIGSYHGEAGFDTFSHHKSLLKRATWGEPGLKYPPYTQTKMKWIRKLFK